jgi:hypothetical protein
MQDEFMTVDEVALLVKLNPQTVRNVVDRGGLPAVPRFFDHRLAEPSRDGPGGRRVAAVARFSSGLPHR